MGDRPFRSCQTHCLAWPHLGGTMEPCNLRRWKVSISPNCDAWFFTCARPGRSKGPDGDMLDDFVSSWVRGLPPGPNKVIVSLLGRKRDRKKLSEFSYYSFYGEWDKPSERNDKPSFQEWLHRHHKDLQILVCEHPTYDSDIYDPRPIHPIRLAAIERDVRRLISEGRTVVVMDSGGVGRTGEVCEYMKATEDTPRS